MPGETYYIQSINLHFPAYSGKKVGEFVGVEDNYGTPFVRFKNLSDIPGATMRSGLGADEDNRYSTLGYRFYLSTKDINQRAANARQNKAAMASAIDRQFGLDPNDTRTASNTSLKQDIGTHLSKSWFGGTRKRKSKKSRKSRKSRKSKKSRK